jgi:CheY-like chemotaxis protein
MSDNTQPIQIIRHVLIVDDDYELADLLSEVLTHENCVPDHASNGMEALSKICSTHYDAIVCDLMMPRLDGRAFFNQVVKDYPHLADQILFITGQVSHQAGLTDFIWRSGNTLLEKPFEIEQFRAALQKILARAR